MTDGDDRDGDPDPLLVSRHSSVGGSSFFPSQRQDSLFMMTWIAGLLMVTIMSGLGSSASNAGADEKIVPMSVSFDPYGQQSQPYQPVYQPQPVYVQPVPQVPYNEALGPPNYGNAPGPSANAIAPEVNPYPRLSRCIITGMSVFCGVFFKFLTISSFPQATRATVQRNAAPAGVTFSAQRHSAASRRGRCVTSPDRLTRTIMPAVTRSTVIHTRGTLASLCARRGRTDSRTRGCDSPPIPSRSASNSRSPGTRTRITGTRNRNDESDRQFETYLTKLKVSCSPEKRIQVVKQNVFSPEKVH